MSVYYVHSPETGLLKIGYAQNPIARFGQIQVHSPTRLLLLAVEDGGRALELKRHREFERLRKRGEWFLFEGPLKAHVEGLVPFVAHTRRKPLPGKLGAWLYEKNISQEEFARIVGTSAASVSRIRHGKVIASRSIRRIYEVTGGAIDANDLLGLPSRGEIEAAA